MSYQDFSLSFDVSRQRYFRGIGDLVEQGFIARGIVRDTFFINPDFLWNGDRLKFFKKAGYGK